MCYRQRVDAEHGNADGKVTQCSIAPHFVSCDAEAEDASDAIKCYDFNAHPMQRLRGTIGDACCDCDRSLGRCIATKLKNAETAYTAKYRDWSDADMNSLTKLGGRELPFQHNVTALGAGRSCGPKIPSLARRMHNIFTGMNLLGKVSAKDVMSMMDDVRRDYWETAEQRTAEAVAVIAEHGVDSVLHKMDDMGLKLGGGAMTNFEMPSLYDITASAAAAEDKFISKIDSFDAEAADVMGTVAERTRKQAEGAKKWMDGAANAFQAGQAWLENVKTAYNPQTWKDVAARFKDGHKGAEKSTGDDAQDGAPQGSGLMDIYDRIAPLLRDLNTGPAP